MAGPSTSQISGTSTTQFTGKTCANTYICPGGGKGFAIQFNITDADVDMLLIETSDGQMTITAAANKDFTSSPQLGLTKGALAWWWKNVVLKYQGQPGPTPMLCIQSGQNGFAVGLAQAIVSAFSVSTSRICGAKLIPTFAPNGVDITVVKFNFFITDIRPQTTPLPNDYLPSSCLGTWILSWIVKSTSPTSPPQAVVPVPATIPVNLQSVNCPAVPVGSPTPTLYFTSEINSDENMKVFLENLRNTFRGSFSNTSFLSSIFSTKTMEHATNLAGTSVILNGEGTSIFSPPATILDYYGMYAYPLSFIGAMMFTVVQLMDINLNTLVANKNLSLFINMSFIMWSIISLSVFFNAPPTAIPYIGPLFSFRIPFILPFNTQSVIVQS